MYPKAALIGLAFALLTPWTATGADQIEGNPNNHIQGVRFDVHGVFGGYGSLGAGMRFDIPLVPEGFLNNVDDEFAISPGVDVFFTHFYHDHYDGGPYVIPSVVVQWNFYLGSRWSVFPEAGLAMYIGPHDHMPHGDHGYFFTPDIAVGGRYHFTRRNALLLRVSYPTGLQFGVTF